MYNEIKRNLKEYDDYYNWKDDVEDMEGNDDVWYGYAENMAEQYPDQYGDSADEVLQQLLCVWKVSKRSRLYKYLLKWYGSKEKLLKEVRNVWETQDAIYFETGIGYSIFDADLLGGNADGETQRKFDSFVQEQEKMDEAEVRIPRNAKKLRLGDEEYYKDGSNWGKSSEKDLVIPRRYPTKQLKMQSKIEGKPLEVTEVDENYKPKRTREVKVLQGNYGSGWDDLVTYELDDRESLKRDRKDYDENEPNVPHRIITRRVPIKEE